jgi:hypothetical protein
MEWAIAFFLPSHMQCLRVSFRVAPRMVGIKSSDLTKLNAYAAAPVSLRKIGAIPLALASSAERSDELNGL